MTPSFFASRCAGALLGLSIVAASVWPLGSRAQAGAACLPGASDSGSRNACALQHFQITDSAHHVLYGDVMRALSAHERPALRKDQNLWTRERQALCKAAHAQQDTHPHWPQLYYDCMTQRTLQRRAALLHWLHHGQAPQ